MVNVFVQRLRPYQFFKRALVVCSSHVIDRLSYLDISYENAE